MRDNRRALLRSALGAAAAMLVASAAGRSQKPLPPPQSSAHEDDESSLNPNLKSPKKILLEENQKDIKKNIEKLFELASQLKEQVEKTDSTTVLSLTMIKKAEEIEKLARQIKERAKG